MKLRVLKSRKLKSKLLLFFDKAMEHPYGMPAALVLLCLTVLLILMPYFISKLPSSEAPNRQKSTSEYKLDKVSTPETITIYRSDSGKTETIEFEEYIKGVVACEMPSSFHIEALKAQSVAARTYSTAKAMNADTVGNPSEHPQAPLCDTTHCQVYKSEKELKAIKGSRWMKEDFAKISNAVASTDGQLLYYQGKLVQQALFHSSSGGATENSEDVFAAAVPYLVSVESPYEEEATHQNEKTALSINEFSNVLTNVFPSVTFGTITADSIKILERSTGDRVEKIQVGSATLTGRQIREALGLASAKFTVTANGDTVTFVTNGSGHGVGMSQYGADGMAKNGYNYKKILSHYYSGTEIY